MKKKKIIMISLLTINILFIEYFLIGYDHGRISKNIFWLFNHPPTNYTIFTDTTSKCQFCGSKNGLTRYIENDTTVFLCICNRCFAKAMFSILDTTYKKSFTVDTFMQIR
jgi:hypothetical protein